MLNQLSIGAILPAAGKGSRMGGELAKQFLELDGKPILVHTLDVFQSSEIIDRIVLAVDGQSVVRVRELVAQYRFTKVCSVVVGGERRQDSVWNGLQALGGYESDIIVVHDAVRPFVTQAMLRMVVAEASKNGAAIVAVPSKDTLKRMDGKGNIESTLLREQVVLAQTPQAFSHGVIMEAFQRAVSDGFCGTDESSLVERLGHGVRLVAGSYENIKITTPEDIELAHLIVQRRIAARSVEF
jgi:2-C-methyl-D-erythritol 4-phosphate cytidylyltransferase